MSKYYHRYDTISEAETAKNTFDIGDHVSLIGTFQKNPGSMTGTFSPDSYVTFNSSQYRVCEYVLFTGSSFVDINYTINNKCAVISEGAFTTTKAQQRWFSTYASKTPPAGTFELYENGSGNGYYAFSWITTLWAATTTLTSSTTSSRLRVTYDMKNLIADIYDITSSTSLFSRTMTAYKSFSEKIYIGARVSGGKITTASSKNTGAKLKLYSFKLYDNEILVRDLIPAQRISDSVYGLFDNVNKVFYTSSTSTPLTGA